MSRLQILISRIIIGSYVYFQILAHKESDSVSLRWDFGIYILTRQKVILMQAVESLCFENHCINYPAFSNLIVLVNFPYLTTKHNISVSCHNKHLLLNSWNQLGVCKQLCVKRLGLFLCLRVDRLICPSRLASGNRTGVLLILQQTTSDMSWGDGRDAEEQIEAF